MRCPLFTAKRLHCKAQGRSAAGGAHPGFASRAMLPTPKALHKQNGNPLRRTSTRRATKLTPVTARFYTAQYPGAILEARTDRFSRRRRLLIREIRVIRGFRFLVFFVLIKRLLPRDAVVASRTWDNKPRQRCRPNPLERRVSYPGDLGLSGLSRASRRSRPRGG